MRIQANIVSVPAKGLIVFAALALIGAENPLLSTQRVATYDDQPLDRLGPSGGLWTLNERDCELPRQYWLVGKSQDEFRSAPDSERIHYKAGFGTKILVSKTIRPAYLIPELKPNLWVKATRPGVQLFLRVVLPRTGDPQESGPMTVLLPGPIYQDTNHWQKLDFGNAKKSTTKLLEEAVWNLRASFRIPIDVREAYVDKIVLNVYSGSGSTTVFTDDLEIPGAVDASSVAVDNQNPVINDPNVRPTRFESQENIKRPAHAQCKNSVIEVRGQPFFARMIQHNGEPFETLKAIGFNVIELQQTATVQQLAHAARLDIWIVCPAPDSAGLKPISAQYDRVLAWSSGENLTANDLPNVRAISKEIRQSDFRSNRPIVAMADSNWFEFARAADILAVGFEPIGGSFILSHYSDWIGKRAELAEKSLPIWASVQTEIPRTVYQQAAAISSRVPPMPVDPAQIKYMAYESIAGGARGLRFLSRSRLDSDDPVTRLRRLTLQWINAQLTQLHPWVAGGAVINRVESTDRSRQITTLATNRSRLQLIQRSSQNEQWVAGGLPVSTFTFSDNNLTSSEQSYHLSESGLIPLSQGRAINGNEISIENCSTLEAVVITQEPMVITRLSESYLLAGTRTQSQMHLEISQQWLAISQLINEQLVRIGQSQPKASGAINEANNALRQAQGLISTGSEMTANRFLLVADQQLASARETILMSARSPFVSSTSSPLLTHVSLVPIHYDLIDRINPADWQANGLVGGDFESLKLMADNGWQNHRSDNQDWLTHVELATGSVVDGQRALLMKVAQNPDIGGDPWPDHTPLWIRSATVPVKAGQLVRIHGWINVAKTIQGSHDGLMIIDSISGPSLAERISKTSGWQEFTFYRSPTHDTNFELTLALTGAGEVLLDEISVRVLDLNATSFRQPRSNR